MKSKNILSRNKVLDDESGCYVYIIQLLTASDNYKDSICTFSMLDKSVNCSLCN